jgi:hypothetical protein
MFQISVVIKLSGLLLLTPSNSDYELPYYALLPRADGHEAYFAYRRPTDDCVEPTEWDGELCYLNIEGYDITIGASVPPAGSMPFNGSLGNVSGAAGIPVPEAFVGEHPPAEKLRGRIRLNAGEQTAECHLGRWLFNGNLWAPLGNVVTWEFTDSRTNDLVLTLRNLANSTTQTLVVQGSQSQNTFELFILHVPEEDDRRVSFLMKARHFNHYYDMLGVDPAGRRPLPRLLLKVGSECSWLPSDDPVTKALADTRGIRLLRTAPGAPTCLVAGGTPAPPGP